MDLVIVRIVAVVSGRAPVIVCEILVLVHAPEAEPHTLPGRIDPDDPQFQFLALASELKYMLSGLRDDINQTNWRAADAVEIDEAVGGAVVRY